MESDGLHAVHLFEDNPSTASWVAQSLSSVADRIKAASHVLPAEVQTVLQDGVDGPAVIIQESTDGGALNEKPFTINLAPSIFPPVLSYDPRKKRTK